MNFDGYQQNGQRLYAEFAKLVKYLLEHAVASSSIARPQSIQNRAKSLESLEQKLANREITASDNFEDIIKDLAGVRLIFYTNTDVDRFLNSRIIPDYFEVDWNETKIHHPSEENSHKRYRAIHYIIRLTADRLALPEYSKFRGLRCEIQIQTILNHAWAETSHDILYKVASVEGFGTAAFKGIEKRLTRLMDEYLLPAGYELQKVQHDYERLMKGKAVFERGPLETLAQCESINEIYEVITSMRDLLLPNYDDLAGIYSELCDGLLSAVSRSRKLKPLILESVFGSFDGHDVSDVLGLAIDIIESYRYVNVEKSLKTLMRLYLDELEEGNRKRINSAIQKLAAYNLNVWDHAGVAVQYELAQIISSIDQTDKDQLRPLFLTILGSLLSTQLRGASATAVDTITIRSGAVLVNDALLEIRRIAILELFKLWDRSNSVYEIRSVFAALMQATQTPYQGNYSNKLLAMILKDSIAIVSELAERLPITDYGLLAHVEGRLLDQYQRARSIIKAEDDKTECKDIANKLIKAILGVRDMINSDEQFVKYKTLVGFDFALPPAWENDNFEFEGLQEYRQSKLPGYVAEIDNQSKKTWYSLIKRCAESDSEDLATFPIFIEFLNLLAEKKPSIAIEYLRENDSAVLNFLPAFLNGLSRSDKNLEYQRLLDHYVANGQHLQSIARHYWTNKAVEIAHIEKLLSQSIAHDDRYCLIDCIVLAITQHNKTDRPLIENIFLPALSFLKGKNEPKWIYATWFRDENAGFYGELSSDQTDLVLDSLFSLRSIDHHVERVLSIIARSHSEQVWEFLLRRALADDNNGDFESIPYQFHYLDKALSPQVERAIAIIRKGYNPGDTRFAHEAGRLFKLVYPFLKGAIGDALKALAISGTDEDVNFVLAILREYSSNSDTNEILKPVVQRVAEDDKRLADMMERATFHSEIVSGELGMVEAYRNKKRDFESWLVDQSPKVKNFGNACTKALDTRIASEQRRAEESRELRQRAFDDDGNEEAA